MYNALIQKIQFYNKLIEYSDVYGKPYTIKYIMNTNSFQQAQEIIQELYRINWGKNAN